MDFRESRGRKLLGLADVGFPILLDFGECGPDSYVELRRKRVLHGLLCSELELALQRLENVFRGDDGTLDIAGRKILGRRRFRGGRGSGLRAGKYGDFGSPLCGWRLPFEKGS